MLCDVEEDDVGMSAQAILVNASIDRQTAIEFVERESELLDLLDYDSWLDLWAEDGLYVIPTVRELRADYADTLNIVYDSKEMLRARVKRLVSGFGIASAPPARTVRVPARYVVVEKEGGASVRCALLLHQHKYERGQTLAADLEYDLLKVDGHIRIARKLVRLINSDDGLPSIGYLL